MKKLLFIVPVVLIMLLASCSNKDIEFDNYDYQTVYFAYQYPVRTITLGDDFVDTSMDNEYKFQIMATLAGVYSNQSDVYVDIVVDESLCAGFNYANGSDLLVMPQSYYQLDANKIHIPKGKVSGGVEVQLTDAFFQDPLAITRNYVVPLRMVAVENADSILSGTPSPVVDNPNRLRAGDWDVLPKDYVLYAVRFINPLHGFYLRRGEDVVTGKNGHTELDSVIIRRAEFVEKDEVIMLTTGSLTILDMPVVLKDAGGNDVDAAIRLEFNEETNNVTVTSPSEDYVVSGSGIFVKLGEKNSWGNKDRDALYLSYEIDMDLMHVATKDTLVMRNRGVGMETFSVVEE